MTIALAVLTGTVVAAPEKRFTPTNTAVTVFTIEVAQGSKRAGQPEEFAQIRINCWRQLAEEAVNLQVGQTVMAQGKLLLQSFTTQQGVNKKQFELEAFQVLLLPGPAQPLLAETQANASTPAPQRQQQAAPAPPQQAYAPAKVPVAAASATSSLSDLASDDFLTEDDIPF
jgi:single-stranded DNA-binding protein